MKKIAIMLVISLLWLCMPITVPAQQTLSARLTYTATEFKLEAEATESYRLMLTVLKPAEDSPDWENVDWSVLESPQNMEKYLFYIDQATFSSENNVHTFSIPILENSPYGWYYFKLDSGDSSLILKYYRSTPQEVNECIKQFNNAEQQTILALLKEYAEGKNILSSDLYQEALRTERFAEYFMIIKNGKYASDFTSLNDIENCVRAGLLLAGLECLSGQELIEIMEKYESAITEVSWGDIWTVIKNYEYDFSNTITILREIEKPKEYAAWLNILEKTTALGLLDKGTINDGVKVLVEYQNTLAIVDDIKRADANDISYEVISKRLQAYSFGEREEILNVKNTISQIIDQLISESSIPARNPSSGGGNNHSRGTDHIIASSDVFQENTVEPIKTEHESAFEDIANVPWALEAIETLHEKNLISGISPGYFAPETPVLREEFVKMLVGIINPDVQNVVINFNDCHIEDWYYPYVSVAVGAGIVNGISENEFGAGLCITRQDMAVLCLRAMEWKGIRPVKQNIVFTDSEEIANYARDAVTVLSGSGILEGFDDGSFRPNEITTRAQAAVIIFRLMKYMEETEVQ